ncbi:MAG: CD225/dispanin family protein [Bacteroidaceae bacterium]|nr:CD225/dispanin family protein [Bacteroidaceae bacterium]
MEEYNETNNQIQNSTNPSGVPMMKPDNNLVWAILCTVLCCVPFGIVSIISATKVDSLWACGQYQEAINEAEKAKKWAIWGAVSNVIILVIYFALVFGFGLFGALMSNLN